MGDTAPRLTTSEMRAVNQLRHKDPKTARKMRRSGDGNLYAQAMYLQKEGIVGTTTTTTGGTMATGTRERKQINLGLCNPALYKRYAKLRGDRVGAEFLPELLDAYEHPAAGISAAERKGLDLLKAMQGRLKLATPLAAAERFCVLHEQAEKREANLVAARERADAAEREQMAILTKLTAEEKRVGELERMNADLKRRNEEHLTRIAHLVKQVKGTPEIAPVASVATPTTARPGAEEALFDFVNAFTGAEARADASGEIVVALPAARLSEMFSIWMRAVKLLGIGTKAA